MKADIFQRQTPALDMSALNWLIDYTVKRWTKEESLQNNTKWKTCKLLENSGRSIQNTESLKKFKQQQRAIKGHSIGPLQVNTV